MLWVVMQATISRVDLYIMTYTWSSKGVADVVSTCGNMVMHKDSYISRFEDEYENIQEKVVPRPIVAHMLYESLYLLDEYNKAKHDVLALKKCRLTQNC